MPMLQKIAQYSEQKLKGISEVFNNGLQVDVMKYADAKIFDIVHNNIFNDIYTSTEGMGGTKELAPNEDMPVSELEDGYAINFHAYRFGNAIVVNETMLTQALDSSMRIDAFLKEQTAAVLRDVKYKLLTTVFDVLNNGTTTDVASAPDSKAFFAVDHTWKTPGAATFSNIITGAMSSGTMDDLEDYAGDFKDASGKEMPLDFDIIIVKKGSAAEREARRLFAEKIAPTKVADINLYEGTKTIVATPMISTANKARWYARSSNATTRNSLRLKVVTMPTMHAPEINGDNRSVKSGVTGYWNAQIVNLPFDWCTGA